MGPIADRLGSRIVVTAGMLVSAMASALTGTVAWLGITQSVNGLAQSSEWPGLLRVTRDWFPQQRRGIVMARWCTNMVLGRFLGTNLAAFAIESGGKWRVAPGCMCSLASSDGHRGAVLHVRA